MKVRLTEHLQLFLKFLSESTTCSLMYGAQYPSLFMIVAKVCIVIISNVGESFCRNLRKILLTEM